MNENANQKVVTVEALAAAAPLLATKEELKDEVKKQIDELPQEGTAFEFASTEDVLALFTKKPAEDGGESE